MSQLTRDQLGDAFNVLTDRVKEGMMAPLYQRMREGYEKELARDKAKEAMKPGNPAPEFTLKDLDGKNFDLSSLRGKFNRLYDLSLLVGNVKEVRFNDFGIYIATNY